MRELVDDAVWSIQFSLTLITNCKRLEVVTRYDTVNYTHMCRAFLNVEKDLKAINQGSTRNAISSEAFVRWSERQKLEKHTRRQMVRSEEQCIKADQLLKTIKGHLQTVRNILPVSMSQRLFETKRYFLCFSGVLHPDMVFIRSRVIG